MCVCSLKTAMLLRSDAFLRVDSVIPTSTKYGIQGTMTDAGDTKIN